MVLLNITDPGNLLTSAEFDFCHPGFSETIDELEVVDGVAYLRTNWYFYSVEISDPHHPVKIVDHRDHDLLGFHADSDYLLMTYYDGMRLCQVTADGDIDVGRVYEDLSAYLLDSPGDDVVLAYAHERQTLIDFNDLIQPRPYDVRMTDLRMPAGETIGEVWLRPFRNMIDVMSLQCRPPEASFRWHGHGLEIWFEDTSRHRVEERLWDFGDGATSTDYAPVHSYAEKGRYRVTLTVSNGSGNDTFARNINLAGARRFEASPSTAEVD
jgi:hypothetical protein